MSTLKNIFIYGLFHRILNTRLSSRWFGRLANARLYPPLLRRLIRIYVRAFGIDLDEFDFSYENVTTFNAFFTRHLNPGRRSWADGICSPVDGRMLSFGSVDRKQVFRVKGMEYKLEELTGEKTPFDGGSFVNLYLSPADYHRIHAPMDIRIRTITHIPGKLLSVSAKNAASIPDLYSKNERVVLSGTSDYGAFYFVLVGALNVGSIRLSFSPGLRTNLKRPQMTRIPVDQILLKGEELGWFEMGSTVLIFLQSEKLSNCSSSGEASVVRLGQALV